MTDADKPGFDFSEAEALASAMHAQLLARRRATLEHDLKNVVHGLMSGTELLAKSLVATSSRITPAECVSLLQQQLGRAQSTLNRILDEVSPTERGASVVDVAELITDCTHALRHQLQMLEVRAEIPPGLQIRVQRPRFKDALLSLLLDCVDRMPPRSRLTISAHVFGDEVAITINHGQTANIAASIVEVMSKVLQPEHASVVVTAQEQQRTVEVRLPRYVAPVQTSAPTPDVLIVDANRDAADSVTMLAQLEGLNAEASYDVAAAVEAVRTRTPKVVLVDIDGSIDVRNFVRTIRSDASTSPRLIALSHAGTDTFGSFDASLRKPLDPAALKKLIP